MAENIPVCYGYTGTNTGVVFIGVFGGFAGGPKISFQGLGGGTLIRMLCKWSHSTDNFIAHVLVNVSCTYAVIESNLRSYCRYASCCWLGWAPAAFGVGHVRSDVYVGKV
jgi:hypothetical protein